MSFGPPVRNISLFIGRASSRLNTAFGAFGNDADMTLHMSPRSKIASLSSITATSAWTPSIVTEPERQEPVEYRMMFGVGPESSRTDQKLTRYGSVVLSDEYGTESVTLLIDDHHALVLAFCDGTAVTAGPSSVKSPLRFLSTNSRVRSAGCSESAVTRIGIHDLLSGPTLMVPVSAGRTDPAGTVASRASAVSGICVPLGLKLGAG